MKPGENSLFKIKEWKVSSSYEINSIRICPTVHYFLTRLVQTSYEAICGASLGEVYLSARCAGYQKCAKAPISDFQNYFLSSCIGIYCSSTSSRVVKELSVMTLLVVMLIDRLVVLFHETTVERLYKALHGYSSEWYERKVVQSNSSKYTRSDVW